MRALAKKPRRQARRRWQRHEGERAELALHVPGRPRQWLLGGEAVVRVTESGHKARPRDRQMAQAQRRAMTFGMMAFGWKTRRGKRGAPS